MNRPPPLRRSSRAPKPKRRSDDDDDAQPMRSIKRAVSTARAPAKRHIANLLTRVPPAQREQYDVQFWALPKPVNGEYLEGEWRWNAQSQPQPDFGEMWSAPWAFKLSLKDGSWRERDYYCVGTSTLQLNGELLNINGLFANQDIKAGSYLGFYVGQVLTDEAAEQRRGAAYHFDVQDPYALPTQGEDAPLIFVIDGSDPNRTGILRYANTLIEGNTLATDQPAEVNVRSVQDGDGIAYVALKNIRAGEELFLSYRGKYDFAKVDAGDITQNVPEELLCKRAVTAEDSSAPAAKVAQTPLARAISECIPYFLTRPFVNPSDITRFTDHFFEYWHACERPPDGSTPQRCPDTHVVRILKDYHENDLRRNLEYLYADLADAGGFGPKLTATFTCEPVPPITQPTTVHVFEHWDGTLADLEPAQFCDQIDFITNQLLQKLGAAAKAGILYRQLTPESVWYRTDNQRITAITIADYGTWAIPLITEDNEQFAQVPDAIGNLDGFDDLLTNYIDMLWDSKNAIVSDIPREYIDAILGDENLTMMLLRNPSILHRLSVVSILAQCRTLIEA